MKTILYILIISTYLNANISNRVVHLAKKGDAIAQYHLATELKDKNPKEAFKWMHKSALKGYLPAQYSFALMFHYGIGVRKNFDLARLWFKRASKKGDHKAQIILYRFYAGRQIEPRKRKDFNFYSQNFRVIQH